jgi:hypothetical protein
MTRSTDRIARLEDALATITSRCEDLARCLDAATASLGRLEDKLDPVTPGGIAGVAADAKAARQSAEAAHAAVRALTGAAAPARPATRPRAAKTTNRDAM